MIYAEKWASGWASLPGALDAASLFCLMWDVQQSESKLRHSMEGRVNEEMKDL